MTSSNLLQVAYRPEVHPSQSHHPPEFIIMVESDGYSKWKLNPSGTPLIEVLASSNDPISVVTHGQTGRRSRPSKQELADHLGTEDVFKAAEFILTHGKLCKCSDMKPQNYEY